jgi:hypothetical protein
VDFFALRIYIGIGGNGLKRRPVVVQENVVADRVCEGTKAFRLIGPTLPAKGLSEFSKYVLGKFLYFVRGE